MLRCVQKNIYLHVLIPSTCECALVWKRGLGRGNHAKDFATWSSWIIRVGPKSKVQCPYKRHTGETNRRGGGNVTTKTEICMMRPQAKEQQGMLGSDQRLEEAGTGYSPGPWWAYGPANNLIPGFWPSELQENKIPLF